MGCRRQYDNRAGSSAYGPDARVCGFERSALRLPWARLIDPGPIDGELVEHARRAVAACLRVALILEDDGRDAR
jgi:hypothetical protein